MKKKIEEELEGATYFVNLIARDSILHADPEIVDNVMKNLATTFASLTSGGASSESEPRFPEGGFTSEVPSYDPLSHLLNKIIQTAIPSISQSILRTLNFQKFKGEMHDKHNSYKGLKPDVIGTINDVLANVENPSGDDKKKTRLTWDKVEVSVESKDVIVDMVRQSGTYARCSLLSHEQKRSFALGIGFHYRQLQAYVFLFHRSGLSSSPPLRLTTMEGFKGLVSHIVGILSIKNEADYGVDPTRFGNYFYINNRLYKGVRIFYRKTLRGRSTAVYSLQVTYDDPPRELDSRMLMLTGVNVIPDNITYKQTYQIKGESQEGRLLAPFHGQFGIVDVIGHYECGAGEPHSSTSRFSQVAEYWNVFGERDLSKHSTGPEERTLQCIAISGEGKALIDVKLDGGTPSPGELLETILHAIIGHYNLYQNGILHRDISSGNVLRYSEPIQRPALDTFDCTRNVGYCRGFLIDGDHAIKWREFSSSQSISGTPEFMSLRLLGALKSGATIIHSAVDDLESFLWLLIWGILYASKDIEGAKKVNPGIDRMLEAWSGDVTANISKVGAAMFWKDDVFGDLIKEWLAIFTRAFGENEKITEDMSRKKLGGPKWKTACNQLDSYCKDIYKEVLESGFRHLIEVKKCDNWDRLVAANFMKFVRKELEY